MLRTLTICLPLAASLGGAAHVAQDRAILAQIGLAPGRGELRALSTPRPAIPAVHRGIRQGGPVCYDLPAWPAYGWVLPQWLEYVEPAYGHPGAFTGVDNGIEVGGYRVGSVFPVGVGGWGGSEVGIPTTAENWPVGQTPVPEPYSIALFVVGLVGLGLVKGRKACFRSTCS